MQNIRKWPQIAYSSIRVQWLAMHLGFVLLLQLKNQSNWCTSLKAPTLAPGNIRTCDHPRNHIGRVVPVKNMEWIEITQYLYLGRFLSYRNRFNSYQFIEIRIINPHDISFVSELSLFFILEKLDHWQSRTRHRKLNGVTPHFSLMWYSRFGIVF